MQQLHPAVRQRHEVDAHVPDERQVLRVLREEVGGVQLALHGLAQRALVQHRVGQRGADLEWNARGNLRKFRAAEKLR